MSILSWPRLFGPLRHDARGTTYRRRPASNRRQRRSMGLEPLEQRQLLAVSPLGGEFRVNQNTDFVQLLARPSQSVPDDVFGEGGAPRNQSVAVDHDGDFVVVWTSYADQDGNGQDGDGAGVFMRMYNRNGVPITGEVQVNTFFEGDQRNASVAMDADGDFVIVWESEFQDAYDGSSGIFAQRFNALGQKVGAEFQVHTNTVNDQLNPNVAMNIDGNFVIVWETHGQDFSFFNDVRGQVFNFKGERVGGEFRVNVNNIPGHMQEANPAVAKAPSGHFVVTWESNDPSTAVVNKDIFARVFTPEGAPLGSEFRVNVSGANSPGPIGPTNPTHDPRLGASDETQRNPAIAMDFDGNFVIAWESYQDNDFINNPDVPDSFGIYWRRFAFNPAAPNGAVPASPFDNQANVTWTGNFAFAGHHTNPSVSMDADGDFAITFHGPGYYGAGNTFDDEGIWVTRYHAGAAFPAVGSDGSLHEEIPGSAHFFPIPVNTTKTGIQRHSSVAMQPDGSFVVVWDGAGAGDDQGIFAQRYRESTDTVGPLVTDVLVNGQRLLQGEQITDANVATIGVVFDERPSTAGGASGTHSVLNPINWALIRDGVEVLDGVREVSLSLDPTLNKWVAVLTVNGDGAMAPPGSPATPLRDGTYALIAKQTIRDVAGNALGLRGSVTLGADATVNGQDFIRLFSVQVPISVDAKVNTTTAQNQSTFPEGGRSVARDGDGNYVVVWTGFGNQPGQGDSQGVFMQRYTPQGAPLGGETRVNTITTGIQSHASVAMDADGDFIVTWSSHGHDAESSWDVFARRFDAAGNARDDREFLVNSETDNVQRFSSVAVNVEGDFVITWQSYDQDGSGYGIYAQRYSASGERLGGVNEVQTLTIEGNPTSGSFRLRLGTAAGAPATGPIMYSVTDTDDVIAQRIENALQAIGLDVEVTSRSATEFSITFQGKDGSLDVPQLSSFDVSFSGGMAPSIAHATIVPGLTGEFRVNQTVLQNQRFASVAMDAQGAFVISWTANGQDGDSPFETNVYARRYDNDGVPLDDEFLVNVSDVINIPNPAGQLTLDHQRSNQRYSRVAMDHQGDFVITWTSYNTDGVGNGYGGGSGGQNGIFARRFRADGSDVLVAHPVTDDDVRVFQVNTFAAGNQQYSSISMGSGGEFVIVWESLQDDSQPANGIPDSFGIYAQRYARNDLVGSPLFGPAGEDGGEFRINNTLDGAQRYPSVASDYQNNFVAVWTSVGQDGSGDGIYSRRFAQRVDVAPPIVADVVIDGEQIREGAIIRSSSVTEIVVTFSEEVNTQGGASGFNSVTNPDNWAIFFNDGLLANVITEITFGFNPTTNKWEARLHLDRDQAQAGQQPLSQGGYSLAASDRIFDLEGNPLDGDRDGVPGTPFVRSFQILPAQARNEFRVNTTVPNVQRTFSETPQSVAVDGDGDFIVTWTSYQSGTGRVFFQQYDRDGNPIGGERPLFVTQGRQAHSAVAVDADGDFIVTWTGYGIDGDGPNQSNIYARRFSASGTPLGAPVLVNTFTTGNQKWSSVAVDVDGDFIITWASQGQDGGGYGIYAQQFNSSGNKVGSEFLVNQTTLGNQQFSQVAMDARGNYVIAWTGFNLSGTDSDVFARTYASDGTAITDEFQLNTFTAGRQTHASVSMNLRGEFIAAWASQGQDGSGYGIFARGFALDGTPLELPIDDDDDDDDDDVPGAEFQVNVTAQGDQHFPSVAADHTGAFTITWNGFGNQEGHDDAAGVFARRFSADGNPLPPPLGIEGESEFRVNTSVAGGQQFASVGVDGKGNFVIAWSGIGVGEQGANAPGVFARMFSHPGDVAGPIVADVLFNSTQVLQGTTLAGTVTQLVVTFSEQMSQNDGILGFDSVTNPNNWALHRNGAEIFGAISDISFGLNPATNKWEAVLTLDGNGIGDGMPALPEGIYELRIREFIADVSGNPLDGNFIGIPGSDFSRTFVVGAPVDVGDEFRVNQTVTDTQRTFGESPQAVAVDDDGDYVVVWSSGSQQGGTQFDIFARLYHADGTPRTDEFRVNTTTANNQLYAAVAVDADGDFVVTWTSYGQDGDASFESNVYARRFRSDGTALTPEILVNTTTEGNQRWSSVATNALGDFVVTWSAFGQDGDSAGESNIFARRFDADGVPLADEFRVNNLTVDYSTDVPVVIPEEGTVTSPIVVTDNFNVLDVNVTVDITHTAVGDLVLFLIAPNGQRVRLVTNQGGTGNNFTATTFDDAAALPIAAGGPPFSGVFQPEEPLSSLVGQNVGGTWTLEITDDEDREDIFDGGVLNGWSITVSHNAQQDQVSSPLESSGTQQFSRVAMDASGNFGIVWEDSQRDGSGSGIFGQRFTADGVPVGANFLVNATTAGNQREAMIAADRRNGDFVVTWASQGQDGSGYGVYARRFAPSGIPLTGELEVNTSTEGHQRNPGVAMDAFGNFVVTWSGSGNTTGESDPDGVFGQRFSVDGARQGAEFRVNETVNGSQQFSSISSDAKGTFVVVWFGNGSQPNQTDGQGVFGRRFVEGIDGAGPIVASVVFNNDLIRPGDSLVGPVNQLVVTFGEDMSTLGGAAGVNSILNPNNWSVTRGSGGGVGGIANVQFSRNPTTNKFQAILTLDANPASPGADPFGPGDYTLTVRRDVRDQAGNALDGTYLGTTGLPGNDFTLSFRVADLGGEGGGGPGGESVPAGDETSVNTSLLGNQNASQVAVDDQGNFVVVWSGDVTISTEGGPQTIQQVFVQRFDAAGVPRGDEILIDAAFTQIPRELSPAVAMDRDGNFVVTWSGVSEDDVVGILAQRFNRFGVPLGRTFQVNTTVEGLQVTPAIAMNANGQFVIAWSGEGQGDGDGVFAQRFDASGARLGGEFRVNGQTAGRQEAPQVAMDDAGNFAVAYNSFGQDGSSWGVFARRYSAAGVPQGNEFQVNTFTTNAQRNPSIAMDADGDFVVAWQSMNQDGSGYGIYARRFGRNGAPAGGEFQVNTTTLNWQQSPTVGVDQDGHFTIAWVSFAQHSIGNGDEIVARSFRNDGTEVRNAQGQPLGEYVINTTLEGNQVDPSIAVDPNGHFVASWTGPDGLGSGIFAQRYRVGPGTVATAIGGGGNGTATVGLWAPQFSNFFLREANQSGPADNSFVFGPGNSGWIPLVGDWDGNGSDTVGFYNPVTSTFFLSNTNLPGAADIVFNFGPAMSGWTPIVGDWDGDGTDSVGFYSGDAFFLTNAHGGGAADTVFGFGPANSGWTPITGDFNGNGTDTVGFYTGQSFFLQNSHSGGPADVAFAYGPSNAGWKPIVGDWNGDGTDTIGLYSGEMFFLRNQHSAGPADTAFSFGPAGSNWTPLAGRWNGAGGSPLHLAGDPIADATVAALSDRELAPVVEQGIAQWRAAGLSEPLAQLLESVDVQIVDLPGTYLGLALSTVIYIDSNAAGHGWYTGLADDGLAGDEVDLLSVVTHEMGHILGLDDLAPALAGDNVMSATLEPGIRRQPDAADVDELFARGLWDEEELHYL